MTRPRWTPADLWPDLRPPPRRDLIDALLVWLTACAGFGAVALVALRMTGRV